MRLHWGSLRFSSLCLQIWVVFSSSTENVFVKQKSSFKALTLLLLLFFNSDVKMTSEDT